MNNNIIIFATIIIITTGTYFIYNEPIPLTSQQRNNESNKKTEGVNPVAWRIHRNIDFGYEIQIPDNLKIEPHYEFGNRVDFFLDPEKNILFSIDLKNNTTELGTGPNLHGWYGSIYSPKIVTISDVDFAKTKGILLKIPSINDEGVITTPSIMFVALHNETFYELKFYGDLNISDFEQKIVDSLQFIN